jgi:hypothetical protein
VSLRKKEEAGGSQIPIVRPYLKKKKKKKSGGSQTARREM